MDHPREGPRRCNAQKRQHRSEPGPQATMFYEPLLGVQVSLWTWFVPRPVGRVAADQVHSFGREKSWARSGNRSVANTNSTKGGKSRVTRVVLRAGESQESLLKRFRKGVTRDRILSTLKRKRYFLPKSEERRIAQRKAIRRERKRQRRAEQRYHR